MPQRMPGITTAEILEQSRVQLALSDSLIRDTSWIVEQSSYLQRNADELVALSAECLRASDLRLARLRGLGWLPDSGSPRMTPGAKESPGR